MKKLILLLALLSPAVARANTVTPQFTTGSMNSTTTTTQTITEVEQRQVFGAAVNTWSGSNITSSASAFPVCSRALSQAINLEISNSIPYFS